MTASFNQVLKTLTVEEAVVIVIEAAARDAVKLPDNNDRVLQRVAINMVRRHYLQRPGAA